MMIIQTLPIFTHPFFARKMQIISPFLHRPFIPWGPMPSLASDRATNIGQRWRSQTPGAERRSCANIQKTVKNGQNMGKRWKSWHHRTFLLSSFYGDIQGGMSIPYAKNAHISTMAHEKSPLEKEWFCSSSSHLGSLVGDVEYLDGIILGRTH